MHTINSIYSENFGFMNNIKTCVFFLFAGKCLIALGDEIFQKSDGPYLPLNESGDIAFMKPIYATQQYVNQYVLY